MTFDWERFAAGFLNQVTAGIKETRQDQEEYEKRQREAAERSYDSRIRTRLNNVQIAGNYWEQAQQYGASEAQIATATASGIKGLQELVAKLAEVHNQSGLRPGQKLSPYDVEQIVGMPNIAKIDPKYIDMTIQQRDQFLKNTFGLGQPEKPEQDDAGRTVFDRLGLGRASVDKRLSEEEYGAGLTVAEINAAARRSEFEQLIPDAVMTLSDYVPWTKNKSADFALTIRSTYDDAMADPEATLAADQAEKRVMGMSEEAREALADRFGLKDTERTVSNIAQKARSEARKVYAKGKIENIIENNAMKFADAGFFKDANTIEIIKTYMGKMPDGSDYYEILQDSFSDISGIEESSDEITSTEDQTKNAIPTGAETGGEGEGTTPEGTTPEGTKPKEEEKKAKPESTNAEQTEEQLQASVESVEPRPRGKGPDFREWQSENKGKYNPDGTAIIADPYPAEDEEVEVKMGRRTQKMSARKAWERKWGKTHDKNRLPKGAKLK